MCFLQIYGSYHFLGSCTVRGSFAVQFGGHFHFRSSDHLPSCTALSNLPLLLKSKMRAIAPAPTQNNTLVKTGAFTGRFFYSPPKERLCSAQIHVCSRLFYSFLNLKKKKETWNGSLMNQMNQSEN